MGKRKSLSSENLLQSRKTSKRNNDNFMFRESTFDFRKNFLHFFESKLYCDLFLISSDGKRFHVHRVVIFAQLPVLGVQWQNKNNQDEYNIDLDGILLEAIIKYCYTGVIEVPLASADLFSLLKFCETNNLNKMEKSIKREIGSNVSTENCIITLNKLDNSDANGILRKNCIDFIIESFSVLVNRQEFLNISTENLADVLKSDDLLIKSEEMVLEAFLKWYYKNIDFTLETNLSNRNVKVVPFLRNVLKTIRLHMIPEHIVAKFMKIWEKNGAKEDIMDYTMKRFISRNNNNPDLNSDISVKPRNSTFDKILNIRWRRPSIYMEILKYNSRRWIELPKIQCSYSHNCKFARIDNENIMLLISDAIGQSYRVDCLNLQTMNIQTMTSTKTSVGARVVSFNGFVYIVGEFGRAERYDIRKNKWDKIAPMNQSRKSFQLVAHDNYLYAIGGYYRDRAYKTMERYDIQKDKWTDEEPMKSARCFFGATVHENFIYAIGGASSNTEIKTVERFDITQKKWNPIASFSEERSLVNAVVFQNQIYVIGGYARTKYFKKVEFYDENQDTWRQTASLQVTAGVSGSFVVPGYVNKIFNKT